MRRAPSLPIHAKIRALQIIHVQILSVELLRATPSICDQYHASQILVRLEDFVDAIHHPDAEAELSVGGQDVDVGQVVHGHHIGDEAGETD